MKKLLVFVGESGSGKTTVIAELVKRYPNRFKKVVTYTSRPQRIHEVDGVDYYFLPTAYFINNRNLVLTRKTDEGYYGTKKSDLFSDTHHLLLTSRLTGIRKLLDLGIKNIIVVRISIDAELKIQRMRQRGDSGETIARRLQEDAAQRAVDLGKIPIIDLDASQRIDEEVETIIRHIHD